MQKVVVLASLLAVTARLASAQAGDSRTAEEELRELNEQEVKALLHSDVTTLKQLWSDDLVVTNPFNKFIEKRQVVEMTESGTLAFTSYDRQVEYVRVYGNTAVVAGEETVAWAGRLPTAGQTSRLRFTAVWMKQSGRWQEVARHASMVVEP